MTDLKKIIEEAYEEGWGGLEDQLIFWDIDYPRLEVSKQMNASGFAEKYKNHPPILTREIFDEIYQLGISQGLNFSNFNPEILAKDVKNLKEKYNLTEGKE